MAKDKKSKKIPKVHKDLEGLDLSINSLGKVQSSIDIDKINTFLNKNVSDKKLNQKKDSEE